jgi:hypothetical protein
MGSGILWDCLMPHLRFLLNMIGNKRKPATFAGMLVVGFLSNVAVWYGFSSG